MSVGSRRVRGSRFATRGNAKTFGSVALLATVVAVGAACDGRSRAAGSGPSGERGPRRGPALAVLDLSGGAPEQEPTGIFGVSARRASFDDLVEAMADIASDDDIKGVFVRFGEVRLGIARSSEIGATLGALREKKPVFCHAEGLSNATMLAAARGCSKIVLAPSGGVETVGIAAQVVYMRKLLADELKLSIDILQVGKFKGAEEPLTRDGPSEEARASLESTLGDIRSVWLAEAKAGRPRDGLEEAMEDGPYSPDAARDRGLVDEIGYAEEVREAAKASVGAKREVVLFGPGSRRGGPKDFASIVRALTGETGAGAPIALVRATGSIAMRSGGGLFGGAGGITERELGRVLAKLEKDDAVKVVVLRIDSPGGSALASDLLWKALMRVRAKKPVVVSVGEMAASGGYYIASAANVIIAEPTSILGSIGVVGGKIGVGAALEQFGVHAETFSATGNEAAGRRAAYLSPLVPWDEPTKVRVLETMQSIYDLFLARIVEGRAMPRERVEASAEGRIFSGREAKERGLVDELGGLRDALARARALAALPADASVEVHGARRGFLEALSGGESGAEGGGDDTESHVAEESARRLAGRERGAAELARRISPELADGVDAFAPLLDGEQALATSPFVLLVR